MSKLFSCFWKGKEKDYTSQQTVKRGRRPSSDVREENEVVYVETGSYIDKDVENQHKINNSTRYRTEIKSQLSDYEKPFASDKNRQSKSYPVSPQRRSLYKVYSFEQRPSIESQRLAARRESRSVMVYATNLSPNSPHVNNATQQLNSSFPYEISVDNVPRRSTLSYGMGYEKELFVSNGSPKCRAEKPGEDYESGKSQDKPLLSAVMKDDNRNIIENARRAPLSKSLNEEFTLRRSSMESEKLPYLTGTRMSTDSKMKSVVRARPQSSKNFALGNSVKLMTYRADDVNHSPMSASKYIHQMPIKASKQPPILTTADGKILKPLSPDKMRKLSAQSSKEAKPIRLSVVKPLDHGQSFPFMQGGEVLVAAPMIGSGGRARKGGKPKKSILRKSAGGRNAYRNEPVVMDDYDDGDIYPYESEYGRGNYGQSYYDDGLDMYSPGTGYYDDLYGPRQTRGYYGYDEEFISDDDIGRYRRGPGCSRGRRAVRQQVYAAQMPDITLPSTSMDKGKNPPFKKVGNKVGGVGNSLNAPDISADKEYGELKTGKKEENKGEVGKGSNVKLISSAQQTDHENELDFICFSPERFFKTAEAPADPSSKLRWRIIIKRGDEE